MSNNDFERLADVLAEEMNRTKHCGYGLVAVLRAMREQAGGDAYFRIVIDRILAQAPAELRDSGEQDEQHPSRAG